MPFLPPNQQRQSTESQLLTTEEHCIVFQFTKVHFDVKKMVQI